MFILNSNRFNLINSSSPKQNIIKISIALLIALFLLLFPVINTNYFMVNMVAEILIMGLLAMSLDIMLGFTGMLSFMHAAYMGISAYAISLFLIHISPSASLLIVFLVGISVTLLIAWPIGKLQVRTGGFAFALMTIAFGMMFYTIIWKSRELTGGDDGLTGIPLSNLSIAGMDFINFNNYIHCYYFIVIIFFICFYFAVRLVNSPLGSIFQAIRESETRASYIGYNTQRYKLISWLIACGYASIAGILYVLLRGFISPTIMNEWAGGAVLMMTLLGGLGSLWGPILGALILVLGEDYISSITIHWKLFLGAIIVIMVIYMPQGLAGVMNNILNKLDKY